MVIKGPCSQWAWDGGARTPEFTVGLGCYEGRDYQSTTPKPVVDLPGLADRITFRVPGKSVHVLPDTG